jgi:signal peptidase
MWLEPSEIVGRARAYVPYVGMVTIIMNDYPQLKVGGGFAALDTK